MTCDPYIFPHNSDVSFLNMAENIKLNFHIPISVRNNIHSLPFKIDSVEKAKVEVYSHPCIDNTNNGMYF